ncbi:hypothetical protein AGDE_09094 [Angomonas deanei]|nr:hypothetical protein AGDE_09094 [Angomonas deanei]|eukprot:EPY31354.1 hypothetical protein AGDE_09094 [Angomonas deanei]
MEDETQDVIQQAVGSALVKVLDKIQNVFNQRADETEEWDQSLKDLIRHEVRSSFAVSMDSEAQTERTEYARQFEEMLKFWKTAELEERERVTKMDEMLLTDLQSMAEQDIARLHSEEQMMEELYLQSRENWALEHQKLLSKEVETAMKRRQEELDEQRSIRHQLHVDRVQDIEQRHKEQLELEGQLHEKAMAQLREHFAREEQLQSDRHRIAMATEQDVVKASASLYHIIENIENVMQSLLTYQRAIDEKGTHLEGAKVKMLEEQEKKLQEIKQLASSQYVSLEAENHKLGEALQALMLVKDKVEHQLQDEAQWLTEQEVKYKRNQEEWEKEYRRWTRTVQEQRKLGEQRFSEALLSLQGSVTQLSQEEKDILREEAELKSAFNDIHNTTEKEIVYLEGKQGTLIQKQEAMADTLADLERQKKDATQHWKQLQVDKSSLNKAREELAEEELRLSEMVQSLEFAKCQIEAMKRQTAEVVGFKENLSRHIPDPQSVTPPVAPRSKPTRDKKKERLPQKVLQDLRRQLDILPPDYTNIMHRDMEKGVAPIQHKTSRKKRVEYRDPNSVPQSDSYPTNSSNIDYSPSTITNFTNLVNFSDIDSASPFL